MIKIVTNEYRTGDLAIINREVSFLGFTIFNDKRTTTNKNIVGSFIDKSIKNKKVKGFYETENKGKE